MTLLNDCKRLLELDESGEPWPDYDATSRECRRLAPKLAKERLRMFDILHRHLQHALIWQDDDIRITIDRDEASELVDLLS